MAKKKFVSSFLTICLAVALAVTFLIPSAALAASAKNSNQTEVHIHRLSGITVNKGSVTITLPDGTSYTGMLTGSTLTLDIGSPDNGFHIDKNETLTVSYTTSDNRSGVMVISHKEGNGTNIPKEHDKGLNNYNGSYTENVPATTTQQVVPTTQPTVPTTLPAAPTVQPTVPTTLPAAPTTQPTVPTTLPAAPTTQPVVPTTLPNIQIPDEDIPLDEIPDIVIPDEDVPLDENPKTADPALLLFASAALSGSGLGLLLLKKKKID